MKKIEHQVQVSICNYLDLNNIFYFAIPNGGYRGSARMSAIVGGKLKREGVKAGIPDLCILHNGGAYFLEVKRPKTKEDAGGTVSKKQVEMFGKINEKGCPVEVVSSLDEVKQILERWRVFDVEPQTEEV